MLGRLFMHFVTSEPNRHTIKGSKSSYPADPGVQALAAPRP